MLCFVQTNELNKVSLGNPNLKPEVRLLFSIDHTLTFGPFSATTGVSAERTNNLMEYYFFGSRMGSRYVIAQMMLNDANYDSDGDEIYNSISRSNNRIVMLGRRWSL